VSRAEKKCRKLFAGLIAPGLAAIILFAPERVLIHFEQPTIGAVAPLWNALAIFITFNVVCFGLLIFPGHIGSANVQRTSEKVSTLKKVP
jgi:D-alanyl-lipoteichoic acid acyltransferase DltB (MBOAT superfamily)